MKIILFNNKEILITKEDNIFTEDRLLLSVEEYFEDNDELAACKKMIRTVQIVFGTIFINKEFNYYSYDLVDLIDFINICNNAIKEMM